MRTQGQPPPGLKECPICCMFNDLQVPRCYCGYEFGPEGIAKEREPVPQSNEKHGVGSETSDADRYVVASRSILYLAGPKLFSHLKEHLGDREIKPEWYLLFNAEVACYIMQMLDRTLAMPAFSSERAKIMDSLVLTLNDAISFMLEEMGYTQVGEEELAKGIDAETFMVQVDKQFKQIVLRTGQQPPRKKGEQPSGFLALVVNGFIEMCNERQLEYGALKKESWLGDIAVRFGKHAGQALEADEDDVVLHCALLAPDIFHVLLPDLVKLADIDI